MKSDALTFFTIVLCVNSFLSCNRNHTLYVPNNVNTPILFEKGDGELSVTTLGLAASDNLGVQAAYAVGKHSAAMANLSFMPRNNDGRGIDRMHYFMEWAGGAYTTFHKNEKGKDLLSANVFTGYGWGRSSLGTSSKSYVSGRYQRAFVQPSIGLRGKMVEFTYAVRIGTTNFADFRTHVNGSTLSQEQFGFSTIESVFKIAGGSQKFKVFVQAGRVHVFGGQQNYRSLLGAEGFDDGIFNVGVKFDPFHNRPHDKSGLSLPPPSLPGQDSALIETLPTEIMVNDRQMTICFQSGSGSAGGESYRLIYDAYFIDQKMTPGKNPKCFDLKVKNRGTSKLRILLNPQKGRRHHVLLFSVESGGQKRSFYLRPELGHTEHLAFRLKN